MERKLAFVVLFLNGIATATHRRKPIVGGGKEPASQSGNNPGKLQPYNALPKASVSSVNRTKVALEDEQRELSGKPPRFAIANTVNIDPNNGDGDWELLNDDESGSITHVWRHRVQSPGCNSLNFGFCEYNMPKNGKLFIYDPVKGESISRPFTLKDNSPAKQLWTPIIPTCDAVIEVNLDGSSSSPKDLDLLLCSINVGYRGFGTTPEEESSNNKPKHDITRRDLQSGECNVDTKCPAGDDWQDEIPAVGAISTGGQIFCTGFMINNANQDRTPYFMTAYHCGINAGNAASLVVYWNYEATSCNAEDGLLDTFQTGSVLKARYSISDFVLVQLNSDPDPAWGITFAGWDNSENDANSAVGIHHPRADEKKISFEDDPTTTTSYLGSAVPGAGTHVRVEDWDLGTTEGGSSGSPLFNQDHRVIGQLHGGYAACDNDLADWYGRISVSWEGGGLPDSRLRDWLDPSNTGLTFIDTLTSTPNPTLPPSPNLTPDPTYSPTMSHSPTSEPTVSPTDSPSERPTVLPTGSPSFSPMYPAYYPTNIPTSRPTHDPTVIRTDSPISFLTIVPTSTSSQTETPTHSPSSKAGKAGKGGKTGKSSKGSKKTINGTDGSLESHGATASSTSQESIHITSTQSTEPTAILGTGETIYRKREREHESVQ